MHLPRHRLSTGALALAALWAFVTYTGVQLSETDQGRYARSRRRRAAAIARLSTAWHAPGVKH
jgi:hypothetical protein